MGRAPAFWTSYMVRLIKNDFIAVSLSNYDQNREDAVGEFIRAAGMKFPGAGGSHWFVTADGKLLGRDVKTALRAWRAIPPIQSRAGTVKVPPLGEIDARRAPPSPPGGVMIVKVWYRAFMHGADNPARSRADALARVLPTPPPASTPPPVPAKTAAHDAPALRYVTGRDLWHDENGTKTEARYGDTGPITRQPQPDHMWLTESEWRSLIPPESRAGDKFPMPRPIALRLCRWHLNPLMVYGEANPLPPAQVRALDITLTIARVTPSSIDLRLEGRARLGQDPPPYLKTAKIAALTQWGYQPRLLGWLTFDREKQRFQRFDVVALGDQFGKLGIENSASRPGCQPLGVAFELISDPPPAECIPPGRTVASRSYFKAK